MQPGFDLDEVDLGLPGTGSFYRPLERTRARKKKGDFWLGVATMGAGCGLMVDWEWAFGSTVDAILPFLKVTGEQAETFPCPAISHCGCRHTIGERRTGGLVATCACGGDRECETYLLEPGDILYHGLQWRAFGEALRRALGLAEVIGPGYSSPAAKLVEIGSYASVAVPVYLSLVEEAALVREVRQLLAFREGPFLLLTPTGRSWSPEVEAMARPYTGGHISLSSVLDVNGKGFVSKGTIEPMLVEYAKRVVLLRENAGAAVQTVRSIHREIAAVRSGLEELHNAKERPSESEAERVFLLMKRLEGGPKERKASTGAVFRLLVLEGLSQRVVAARCGCAESLVSARVATIEEAFGMGVERLRNFASELISLDAAAKGQRTRKRKHGQPDDFERAEDGDDVEVVPTKDEDVDDGPAGWHEETGED